MSAIKLSLITRDSSLAPHRTFFLIATGTFRSFHSHFNSPAPGRFQNIFIYVSFGDHLHGNDRRIIIARTFYKQLLWNNKKEKSSFREQLNNYGLRNQAGKWWMNIKRTYEQLMECSVDIKKQPTKTHHSYFTLNHPTPGSSVLFSIFIVFHSLHVFVIPSIERFL